MDEQLPNTKDEALREAYQRLLDARQYLQNALVRLKLRHYDAFVAVAATSQNTKAHASALRPAN